MQLPLRVAELAGLSLKLPPRQLLGHFQTPGRCEDLLAYLEQHRDACSAFLVSLDMACFGGLVASRSLRTDLSELAQARLARLADLLEGRPTCAFQAVMRTAPTQTTQAEVEAAGRLVELSVLACRRARGEVGLEERCRALEAQLDPVWLSAYRQARQRNHELNLAALEQAAKGSWQLLLGIDDSRTEGWNVLEVERLEERLRQVQAPAWIAPGTDESALLMLCRLAPVQSLELIWSHPGLGEVVGLYEDRNLAAVVAAQARAAGVTLDRQASRKLFVWGPRQRQTEPGQSGDGPPPKPFLDRLETALEEGQEVVLADVCRANGGDLAFGRALLERPAWTRLLGYSAWNTAGNTLGTALAMAALAERPVPERARRQLLVERLGDDLLYQSQYRLALRAWLGHPGWSLTPEEVERSAAWLESNLGPAVKTLAQQAGLGTVEVALGLPWSRAFEVDLQITGS